MNTKLKVNMLSKSIFPLSLIVGFSAFAQDTLRTDVVDVVKAFKPVLSESIKIQSNPNPEIPETKTPEFNYNIPEKRLGSQPTLYTIKPLSLGTSILPKLKNNYTKLGYGTYNTPLFETYIATTRNKNVQAGLFVKHLSSNPEGDRAFSNNTAYVYGKRFLPKGIVSGDLYYYRNLVHLYGVNREGTTISQDDIQNKFETIDATVSYQNILKDTSKLSTKLTGKFSHFTANSKDLANENNFAINGLFGKRINGNPLQVKLGVNIVNTTSQNIRYNNSILNLPQIPAEDYNRTFVEISPNYRLNMDALYINIGFNSTFFGDSNGTKFYFFPVAEAGYAIIKNSLTTYIGITGNLQQNTYRSLSTENPFIRTIGLNHEYLNTVNSFELYGGFKGILSPQTSFVLNAGLANKQNMLFFVGDSAKLNSQTAYFDKGNSSLFNIKAELNHEFDQHFQFGFVMNYYSYSLTIAAPFSLPTFTTQWNIGYNMGDKFLWKAQVYTMNKRETAVQLNNELKPETLKGFVDLNLGLDYRYTKNISLFIALNNLANNQYQRWVNLPVYGFNAMGGLTVTF
jgi:hypothetical protein